MLTDRAQTDIPESRSKSSYDSPSQGAVSSDTAPLRIGAERRIESRDNKRALSKDGTKFKANAGRLQMDGEKQIESINRKKRQKGTAYSKKFALETKENPAVRSDSPETSSDSALQMEKPRLKEHESPLQIDSEKRIESKSDQTQKRKYAQKLRAQEMKSEIIQDENIGYSADIPNNDISSAENATQSEISSQTQKKSRLQFAADEKTAPVSKYDRKLENTQKKLAKTVQESQQAEAALPKKKKLRYDQQLDADSGKMKGKFHFEETTKTVQQHMKGSLPLRPVKFAGRKAADFAHRKVSESEHENVGVEAAHKGEKLVERGVRKAYKLHKSSPYRKSAKLQKKVVTLERKAAYQKVLAENPKLKSNPLSRLMQKRKIKKEYVASMRAAKKTGNIVKRAASTAKKAITKIAQAIRSNPKILAILAIIGLLIIIIMSVVQSGATIANGVLSGVAQSTYQAADADINKAELLYQQWEVELQMKIQNAERDHPGYDAYEFEVDDIEHNPYELIAFLTAVYGSYEFDDIQTVLRELFDEQYQLTFTPEVLPDGTNVLHVKLTAKSFSDVIAGKMTAEQTQVFDTLMESLGNRQYLVNPFDFNWLPYVTVYLGHRVNPDSGINEFHTGIDITVNAGTTIKAGHAGKVVKAEFDSVYGNSVLLDNEKGLQSKYAQCQSLLVSAGQTVKKGDPIATVGNTGSAANGLEPHLHMEIIKDGQFLNPLFFGESGNVGDSSPLFPDNPGAAMGDGTYQAMIAEAEKHLGKKYVFGSKGPDTFDCSSFVSWVLDKSGVRPGESHDAQGWYNKCTPVSPDNAQPGDLIFFQGTYSTHKTVTHIGIYVGNGQMIHCGKPVQYASINTPYWKKHFYSFGRLA